MAGLRGIEKVILEGADQAFQAYSKMSGGHWLGDAPESFIQASIARNIFERRGGGGSLYVTLEASPKRILGDCDIKIDKRSVKMRDNQRFDILLWSRNNLPSAAIEIKKCWRSSQCNSDAKRIRQCLSGTKPLLRAGYIVAYSSARGAKAKETLRRRFARIAENAGAEKWLSLGRFEKDEDGWAWDAACISLV